MRNTFSYLYFHCIYPNFVSVISCPSPFKSRNEKVNKTDVPVMSAGNHKCTWMYMFLEKPVKYNFFRYEYSNSHLYLCSTNHDSSRPLMTDGCHKRYCICQHVCVRVCIYICIYVYICIYRYVCTYTHICVCVHIYVNIHIWEYVCVVITI